MDYITTLFITRIDAIQVLTFFPAKIHDTQKLDYPLPNTTSPNFDPTSILTWCLICPFTSVHHCRNYQDISHTTKSCQHEENYVNWRNSHPDMDSSTAPHCSDCPYYNNSREITSSMDHTAADKLCSTYKHHYIIERQRLNAIFPSSKRHRPPLPSESPFHKHLKSCAVHHLGLSSPTGATHWLYAPPWPLAWLKSIYYHFWSLTNSFPGLSAHLRADNAHNFIH